MLVVTKSLIVFLFYFCARNMLYDFKTTLGHAVINLRKQPETYFGFKYETYNLKSYQ